MTRTLPKQISISAALLTSIALMSIVVGALCAKLVTLWGAQEIHRNEGERLAMTARNVASQISLSMAERHGEIRVVRDLFERELAGAPAEQKRQVMERIQAGHQHFSWLGVVAADGTVQIGTAGLLEGLSVAGRNWFEGALQAPVFFGNVHPARLLEPHIRNPDGAPLYLLDIAVPLRGPDGRAVGVLGSHFNWKMIQEVVHQILADAPTEATRRFAAIINPDGMVLYDTDGGTGNVADVLKAIEPGRMAEVRWLAETEQSFLAVEPVPATRAFDGLGWRVVVRESAPAVNARIDRMQGQVAVASLLAGLLFAGLGLLAVRRVTRPLESLVDNLKRFGETEVLPAPTEEVRIVEVRNLHGAFLAMAAKVAAHGEMLRDTQAEIVRTLGRAGEFRDNETGNHVLRMSLCCERLALLAGWDAEAAAMLRLASQMHDVGKIGIPDHVLLKPGRFDAAERAVMERHCEIGARILTGVDTPLTVMARTIAISHHEKWDGSGYPNRLVGEAIPAVGRIAAICDVFDALLSSRPYKQGWSMEQVVAFLGEQGGYHFDPALVSLFLAHLDDFVAIRDRFRDELPA